MPQGRLIHQPREWFWALVPWIVVIFLGFLFAQPPTLGWYYRRQLYLCMRTLVGTSIEICLKVLAFCADPLYGCASLVWKMLKHWQKTHQDELQAWIKYLYESMRDGLGYWIPRLWESVRNRWIPWSLRQCKSLTSFLYTGCSFGKAITADTVRSFIVSTAILALSAMVVGELYKRKRQLVWTSLAQKISTKTLGFGKSRFRMGILGIMVVCAFLFWRPHGGQLHLKYWWGQLAEFSRYTVVRVNMSFWNWLNGKGLLL